MGVAPTGKQLTVTAIDIARLENGKIVDHWGEMDMAGLMRQLGLIAYTWDGHHETTRQAMVKRETKSIRDCFELLDALSQRLCLVVFRHGQHYEQYNIAARYYDVPNGCGQTFANCANR